MSLLRRLFVGSIVMLVIVVNVRLYTPISGPASVRDVQSNLSFIRGRLDDGLGNDMQRLFPEGYYFSHVLYGLSWVEVGLREADDGASRQDALREARWALDALDTPLGRAPFSPSLDPAYGMFYVGWTNYLRAGIVALQPIPDVGELDALRTGCDEVVGALDKSASPFIASYPGQVWPVDTYPAMVSLQGCAEFIDPSYEVVIAEWLDEVDAAADSTYELSGHRTEPFVEHPRATSQTLILRFLAELDPARARTAYRDFRREFVVARLGMPAVREHPRAIDADGDVDSGPLIAGVSASASVVAIATAQTNGDDRLARALRQEGTAFGFPLPLPGGKRYVAGVFPLGDLFIVWASTSRPWFQPEPEPLDSGPKPWWRLPTHLLSFAGLAMLWLAIWPSVLSGEGCGPRWRRTSSG